MINIEKDTQLLTTFFAEKKEVFMFEKGFYFLMLNWQYCLLLLFLITLLRTTTYKTKHKFNVWVANKHIKKLKNIEGIAQKFGFCRAINPYIFEEMVLTSFKKSGYKIKRSSRYSKDGGIDGMIRMNGDWVFIQTKRYKSHIKKSHVSEFRQLCENKNVKGVFVHCGRTSKNTRKELGNSIEMVSGNRLINLLVNHDF